MVAAKAAWQTVASRDIAGKMMLARRHLSGISQMIMTKVSTKRVIGDDAWRRNACFALWWSGGGMKWYERNRAGINEKRRK